MKAESTTGDETAKAQKQVVIYLLADDHIEVAVKPLTMGDLCEIVGTDRKVADFVKQMPVTGLQNIIYMREQEKALVIMRDITEGVRKQEQLRKVKLDTVAMAQNVINKQMMVAQEIAGLLGETTAETKSTLRKLRDTLMDSDEDIKI